MKSLMRRSAATCALLAVLSLIGSAQNGKDRDKDRDGDRAKDKNKVGNDETVRILSLENVWNEAEVNHDAQALSMILADTFEYTDDDGSYMNREQWLAYVGKKNDLYQQLGNSGMIVHLYGNVAIVNGEYRETLKIKGKTVLRRGRFTDTWIRQDNEWKCAASQSTLISP